VTSHNHEKQRREIRIQPQWMLFGLFVVVILSLGLVFIHPTLVDVIAIPLSGQDSGNVQQSEQVAAPVAAPTPTGQTTPSTTEEIGSTDGIILWATVLVLILIIGTLRETLHRKGH
jgi:hypothetical protein